MKFVWPESGRAELRTVDRETVLRILHVLAIYGKSGEGDVKALSGEWQGYSRLRVGDYRVIFTATPDEILIARVQHRSDVYR